MATYKNSELFLIRPDWTSGPELVMYRKRDLLQFLGYGYQATIQPVTTWRISASWLELTRAEIKEVVDFFDSMKGRYDMFWMPSWTQDIIITDEFLDTDTTLTIQDIDYSAYWRINPIIGRHIYIEWPDGTYQIVAVQEALGGTLTLAAPIGRAATLSEIGTLFCCFLLPCRFDTDVIEIEHETAEVATIKLALQTTGVLEGNISVTSTTTTTTSTSTTSSTSSTSSSTISTTSTSTTSSTVSTVTTRSTTSSTASSTSTASTATTGPPQNWYVHDTLGNNTYSGDADNPFKTISRAIATANSGDTIYVYPGTYDEETFTYLNDSVTILGITGRWQDVIIRSYGHLDGGGWIRINGTNLRLTLKYMTIEPVDSGGAYEEPIFIPTAATNFTLELVGIFVKGTSKLNQLTNWDATTGTIRAYKCTFINNNYAIYRPSTAVVISAIDNIFKGCFYGIYTISSATNVTEDHNCFYGNTYNTGLTLDATDITSDPLLMEDNIPRLRQSSPCLNVGTNVVGYVDTWEGAAPDMGCDESATGATTTTTTTTTTSSTSTTSSMTGTTASTASTMSTFSTTSSTTSSSSTTTTTNPPEYYQDSFTDADGSPPTGWTAQWNTGSEYTVEDEATGKNHKVLRFTNASTSVKALSFNAVGNIWDAEIYSRVRRTATLVQFYGYLFLRGSGTSSTYTGYAIAFYGSAMQLIRYKDGASTSITGGGSPYSKTFTQNTWYKFRFRIDGYRLRVRVWNDGDAEPGTWQIDYTDTSTDKVTTQGWVGVNGYYSGANAEWDYLAVATNGGTARTGVGTTTTTTTTTTSSTISSSSTTTTAPP